MFLDALCQLSLAQALTATAVSTNTYDAGNSVPKRDLGAGEPVDLMIAVKAAADFTSANETYEFQAIQSANADLSSPDVLIARVVLAADLPLGAIVKVPIPVEAITKRYIGARYVLGGTTPLITVDAYLQPRDMASNKPRNYASGSKVS